MPSIREFDVFITNVSMLDELDQISNFGEFKENWGNGLLLSVLHKAMPNPRQCQTSRLRFKISPGYSRILLRAAHLPRGFAGPIIGRR
jgi:hypothetical protein